MSGDQVERPVLEGVRVLDLSHAGAGPYCAQLLVELGADVVKLEPPGGDHFRPVMSGACFENVNRGKRGICVDLRDPAGQEVALRLANRADVLVESFSPGTTERLGVDHESVARVNPGIVYASISGFGQTGPYRNRRGYDVVGQAMSGLMSVTGEPDRPPVRIGTSAVDFGTGQYAAFSVLAALMRRQATGKGCRIDVSLVETALSWMNYWVTWHSMTGLVPERRGSGHEMFAPYEVFETKDGSVFIGATSDAFFERLCQHLDIEWLLDDPRFGSITARSDNRDALSQILREHLARLPTDWVVERLEEAGVPFAPVLSIDEVLRDPHYLARDAFERVQHPEMGEITMPRLPLGMSCLPIRDDRRAPRLGEHTRETLSDLGVGSQKISELLSRSVVSERPPRP